MTKATYVSIYRGMVITAPDTPAYVCDTCGYQEFEHTAIKRLLDLTQPRSDKRDSGTVYLPTVPSADTPTPRKPPQPK
jgi:hypothetical protein